LKSILNHRVTRIAAGIFIALSVLLIIYPPEIEFFQSTSEYAPQLMFGLLFLSLLLLVFNQTKLMVISMMATAFIAFYLKMASNTNLIYPSSSVLPKISVANFNLSTFNREHINLDSLFNEVDADLISFQEYTPDWDKFFLEKLLAKYPFAHRRVKANPFGMAIYSKKSFKHTSNFDYKGLPNINILIQNEMEDINVICSYIPTVYPGPDMNNTEHLNVLTQEINKLKKPVITMGDFHMVYWSQELNEFMAKASMENSRRSSTLLRTRIYDHIFFSDLLECTQFKEIQDGQQNHIGIIGTYQLRSNPGQNSKPSVGLLSNF